MASVTVNAGNGWTATSSGTDCGCCNPVICSFCTDSAPESVTVTFTGVTLDTTHIYGVADGHTEAWQLTGTLGTVTCYPVPGSSCLYQGTLGGGMTYWSASNMVLETCGDPANLMGGGSGYTITGHGTPGGGLVQVVLTGIDAATGKLCFSVIAQFFTTPVIGGPLLWQAPDGCQVFNGGTAYSSCGDGSCDHRTGTTGANAITYNDCYGCGGDGLCDGSAGGTPGTVSGTFFGSVGYGGTATVSTP